MKSRYADQPAFVTKDGSTIRELWHPQRQGAGQQSLAEARIAPGAVTALHRHRASEEIYYVLDGSGCMTLGAERLNIHPGDSIRIAPDTPHSVHNDGDRELVILCCCTPPYSHEDTDLL